MLPARPFLRRDGRGIEICARGCYRRDDDSGDQRDQQRVGIFKYNLSADAAFQQYVLMTIGDGLVAQIPSLLLSTAAAIIVTRVSDNGDRP